MMRFNVLGIGWVTAANCGRGADALEFAFAGGPLPKLDHHALFGTAFPRFGRLDAYTRLGLAGIALALRDAGLDSWTEKRPLGLVASTESGCLETDLQYFQSVLPDNGRFASPNLFAYTLPSCMLGEASIHFGLTGPAFVVQEGGGDVLAGLKTALGMLSSGLCSTVVAGVCNAPAPPVALAFTSPPGAVFFVIECAEEGPLSLCEDAILWRGQPQLSIESLIRSIRTSGYPS